MITFPEFPFQTPDMTLLQTQFKDALERFKVADTFETQVSLLEEIYALRQDFDTNRDLGRVRHTADTLDEAYKTANQFFDENGPIYEGLTSDFFRALLASPFREQLEAKFGPQLFAIASLTIKTFDPSITEDLQQENQLTSDYMQLLASAKIPFEGEERNLSQLGAFTTSVDRAIRKGAQEARWDFMASQQDKLDQIYDDLVKTRTKIAHKLGYENFVQLGYDRMLRTDYGPEQIAQFRKLIREYVVPLTTKLHQQQAERLGLPGLKYFDEPLQFADGNAKPQGGPDWIIDQGQEMYDRLSPETAEFYRFMKDRELMDLVSRKGKAGGGYCTYISKYEAPFIFANFNGTGGDIFVLTHEAGHAFQCYRSKGQLISEYQWPTLEACEIHSMSMEYFTWPFMDLFFGEQAEKYRFGHLLSSLLFLAYGAAVDEFQHRIYELPDLSPQARNALWREIEQTYLPHRDYDGLRHLEEGGFWQVQRHIYAAPFYYIDYVLAQVCAFQFWMKHRENPEETFKDYVRLCDKGGSMGFLDLVSFAGLHSPFESSSVESVVRYISAYLSTESEKWRPSKD